MLAIDNANAKGGIAGYKIDVMQLDDGTATAGQYDPAQAATNARKMVSDDAVVAAIGPQMSGSGKAMAPILSQGDLATITPSSTNPDITDPKFAAQYMPGGKAIYFRTVTTDAFQGPNMANYFADTLKVKSVYVLDDSGAYGVGPRRRVPGAGEKARHQCARPRPARSQGGRLHDHPDQDEIAQPRRALLWRRRAGRGQGGQAVLRHRAHNHQVRRRRRLWRRDPDGRRLPRGAGLVRHDRRAERARKSRRGAVYRAVRQEIRQAARQLFDHRLRCGAGDPRRDPNASPLRART